MNPENPYWFLFVLYLRKNNRLNIINNYDTHAHNVLASIEFDECLGLIPQDIIETWKNNGILNRCVVGDFTPNSSEDKVFHDLTSLSPKTSSHYTYQEKLGKTPSVFQIKRWEMTYLLEVVEQMLEISDQWIADNFAKIFDDTLTTILSKEKNESLQPLEITQLVSNLLDYKNGTVYNPFAGLASYGIILNAGNQYIGQEINPISSVIAELRLLAMSENSHIRREDSFNNLPTHFEYAVSTPPFGLKENAECFFLEETAFCARKTICVLPLGFLTSTRAREYQTREKLVCADLLECIITLPSNLFAYTNIPTCIVVTNRNKKNRSFVRLIDCSHCYNLVGNDRTLDIDSIMKIYFQNESEFSIDVDIVTLTENKYNLSPNNYLWQKTDVPNGYKFYTFEELGTFLNKTTAHFEGKLITPKYLSDPDDFRVKTAADFPKDEFERATPVNQDSLIISSRTSLRPTLFSIDDGTAFAKNCYVFIANSGVVLSKYLAIELNKKYVTKQLKQSNVASFSLNEIKHLHILVPSISIQKECIENKQTDIIADLGIELKAMKNAEFDTYEKNMHLRKHALSQIMNEVLPASDKLYRFIEQSSANISKDTVVSRRSGATLETYLQKLNINIHKLTALINNLTADQIYGDEETFDICAFIDEYKSYKFEETYEIVTRYTCEVNNNNQILVNFSKQDLTTVFDNIFNNAKMYGFILNDRMDYCIRIDISTVDEDERKYIEIKVANNGETLAEGMTSEMMFHWGIGQHTGLGTWQAKQIVEHFNGKISFIQNDNAKDGFKVQYSVILPIID